MLGEACLSQMTRHMVHGEVAFCVVTLQSPGCCSEQTRDKQAGDVIQRRSHRQEQDPRDLFLTVTMLVFNNNHDMAETAPRYKLWGTIATVILDTVTLRPEGDKASGTLL